MRYYLALTILFITTTVLGQTRDKRAELEIRGAVNEISVSPDEKIWIVTAIGKTYFTDNIDSNWHYGKPLFESKDDYGVGDPHLERISFFNKDTAILTGYISAGEERFNKNGYYLTRDGGKTWKLLSYGGDSWIYTIHTDQKGNAWMGGLKKELYYSGDHGQTWTTIKLPYKSSDRTYGVFMIDQNSGIASSDNNEIIITENNWKSTDYIKTPFDQKKYSQDGTDDYPDTRISKIIKWNNYIVVNQNGHIFYTETSNIEWKTFPEKIVNFEIDADSKKLFAVTDSLKILLFSSPTEYKPVTEKKLSSYPIDLKVMNHSLYVISQNYEIYRVNEKGLTRTLPYTYDTKISDPQIIKRFAKLNWGISENQVYLAEDKRLNWYRENALDFSVADFKLQSDSVAILWDGTKNNYIYSLNDRTPKLYYPSEPIKSFLEFPIRTFSINSGSQGCFHSRSNEVKYERINDSTLSTSSVSANDYHENDRSRFKNKVNSHLLSGTLARINSDPYAIPSLKDFQITEDDRKNYLSYVDKHIRNDDNIGYNRRRKKTDKTFYYSVPSMLDTLKGEIIKEILDQRERSWSTTSNWFSVQIINQNNDTLNISRNYYVTTSPWNLPWKVSYNGLTFNSYNVELSQFIDTCIPEDFMDKAIFDNKLLIMQIADYLNEKQQ